MPAICEDNKGTDAETACRPGDIPQRHISEMENGKRNIGKERAVRLAQVLDIDYRLLL
jgi:plasmid maintenance system antidote protein VapI